MILEGGTTELAAAGPYSYPIPPVFGGLAIKNYQGACSNSFGAYKDIFVHGRTHRTYFTISAGHCQSTLGEGKHADGIPYSHDHHHIGTSYASTLSEKSRAYVRTDGLSIHVRAKYATNLVYYRTSDGSNHLRGILHRSRVHTGELACHSGAGVHGYFHCGRVLRRKSYYFVDSPSGRNVVGPQRVVDFHGRCEIARGDSGGPVFYGTYARGTINTLGLRSGDRCAAGEGTLMGVSQFDEELTDLRHLHILSP